MTNNPIDHEKKSSAVAQVTPMHMLQAAIEKGASLDQMKQLMDLQERWEANEARKAYVSAMSEFKANPPKIIKDKNVSYNNTQYSHSSLGHISEAIGERMGKLGLSFRWDVSQAESIKVTCIVTHSLGHYESTSLVAEPDKSGAKNSIQAIGSTVTYLQRYTLLAATGLASMDSNDDDGRGSTELINEEQRLNLIAALDESNFDEHRWLKHHKLENIGDIPARSYEAALASLIKAKKVSDDNS